MSVAFDADEDSFKPVELVVRLRDRRLHGSQFLKNQDRRDQKQRDRDSQKEFRQAVHGGDSSTRSVPGSSLACRAAPWGRLMALRPQPISWPLTGGLAGDSNPLSVQPGSHLRLDDVKQERADEWRARQGFDAVTMSPGPVQVGAKADGGLAYLADTDGDVMRFYDSGTSTTSYGDRKSVV